MQHPFKLALVSALFAMSSVAQLDVSLFGCTDCKCSGADGGRFEDGGSIIGQCQNINVGFGPVAVGLSGGSSAHCTMFATGDCSGVEENVGIHSGQSFGCTGTKIGVFGSFKCFTR
ncbi:hypothetical protein DM02DRAFT_653338 [Periconia macrospinosa]|uniref:Uncharacterized protein n=1 Tax=Periconia macrospinosa TaxID=97972 RepID=A0A2V1DZM3_9PLEO|nr:hypothetical protein DM02DRAFT_653338 [Periconia macrospinosa]